MKNINGALFLCRYGDHYEWNKAVTCINNVLSQQRWLEHYGEVVIRNTASDVCTCKITFVKVRTEPHQRLTVEERQHVSSLSNSPLQKDGFIINRILSCSLKSRYWSSDNGKNEVQGVVLNRAGEVVHRFGGFWHEGIFCDTLPTPKCIWKPSEEPKICFPEHGLLIRNVNTVPYLSLFSRIDAQPEDFFDFYGFSRYARELNELTPELEAVLPPTDTRFRPDQRFRACCLGFLFRQVGNYKSAWF